MNDQVYKNKNLVSRILKEGLGIHENLKIDLPDLLKIYSKSFAPSVLQRFYTFKTSGGIDHLVEEYKPTALFNPLKLLSNQIYTSVVGKNVLLTSVFTPYIGPFGSGDVMKDINSLFDENMVYYLKLMGHQDAQNLEIQKP